MKLVPLPLVDAVEARADLFMSTWGLSESTREAHNYVVARRWFEARHLLIGFQHEYTSRV